MKPANLLEAIAEPAGENAKTLGAYYTDARVADFLVWWAVRSPQDTVLDPSFGGGTFLRSACKRLRSLGAHPGALVWGIEIDQGAHARTAERIGEEFGVRKRNLICSDFFEIRRTNLPPINAIVGNPPFIRYQRFSGTERDKAQACAIMEGVRLTSLSSSWAPFLVHSVGILSDGGRLAMVLPAEISHAAYATPVLSYLKKSFGKVTFLTFRKKLFPNLSEDTLLALAENKGAGPGEFFWRDFADASRLVELQSQADYAFARTRRVNGAALAEGHERLSECFVPRKALELYRHLAQVPDVRRLGDLAIVGIGYVTGANDFFHLDPQTAKKWRIPIGYLRPAVRRGRALQGLRFTSMDWKLAAENGDAGYLLYVESDQGLPESVLAYLEQGEKQGVPRAYKCRSRSPWFRVPHVYLPDAFLTYMSGVTPRLVANAMQAVAPNTLHVIRLRPEARLTSDELAASWQTSLTGLSTEIEGHAMGGGMLKLEPTEAQDVLLVCHVTVNGKLAQLAEELDSLVRSSKEGEAHLRADDVILKQGIGLTQKECRLLRSAADHLRNRRYTRSATT
jgi:adenine-specific DNA methylase